MAPEVILNFYRIRINSDSREALFIHKLQKNYYFFFVNNIASIFTVAREKNLKDIINKLK